MTAQQIQSPPIPKDNAYASQPISLRVVKGALVPVSDADTETLRRFRLRVGQLVVASIDRPRHPEGLRLLHSFAQLISQNVEGFEHHTAHQVIKKLQAQSGVGCTMISTSLRDFWRTLLPSISDALAPGAVNGFEEISDMVNAGAGDRMITGYQPKSLSAATMDDSEFQEIFDGLCRYVALTYWPSMTAEQVAETARLMPDSTP